jgi:hypothetical protein
MQIFFPSSRPVLTNTAHPLNINDTLSFYQEYKRKFRVHSVIVRLLPGQDEPKVEIRDYDEVLVDIT